MPKTVERPIRFFPLRGDSIVKTEEKKESGEIKDGVFIACIDFSPQYYLNESDVILVRDVDGDGKISSQDAAQSSRELLDLLHANGEVEGAFLLSKGFVAAILRQGSVKDTSNFLELGGDHGTKSSLEWTRPGKTPEKLIKIEAQKPTERFTRGPIAIIEQE